MQQRYTHLLHFPIALHFQNAALGSRRKIVIGKLTGTLALPRPNNEGLLGPDPMVMFDDLVAPSGPDIGYAVRVYDNGRDPIERLRWGNYFTLYGHDPVGTAIAAVSFAVVRFPEHQHGRAMDLDEIIREFNAQLDGWSSYLSDWIEVATTADLDYRHPLTNDFDNGRWSTQAWVHTKDGKLGYDYGSPTATSIGSDGEDALSASVWSSAIRGANQSVRPKEEWLLIRDARAALRRRNSRKCVLDSATAVELTIDTTLRSHLLRSNSDRYVTQLLKRHRQVSQRLDLMTILGMPFPLNINQDLVYVRNKVTHQNATVTNGTAKAAVEVAENLVARYSRLRLP